MTHPIARRLDRLETEVQKKEPAYGPVFELLDDPRDTDNAKRLAEAVQFKLQHPHGMILHRIIVRPPDGHQNWEHFHATGSSAEIADQQSEGCSARLDAMIVAANKRSGSFAE
jgi:hypothetical protein